MSRQRELRVRLEEKRCAEILTAEFVVSTGESSIADLVSRAFRAPSVVGSFTFLHS